LVVVVQRCAVVLHTRTKKQRRFAQSAFLVSITSARKKLGFAKMGSSASRRPMRFPASPLRRVAVAFRPRGSARKLYRWV